MKAALFALFLAALPAWSQNLVHVEGEIIAKEKPIPGLPHFTYLDVVARDGSYMILDHPDFANLAKQEKVSCYVLKGRVDKTDRRIWIFISKDPPTQADKDAAADRMMKRYREKITF